MKVFNIRVHIAENRWTDAELVMASSIGAALDAFAPDPAVDSTFEVTYLGIAKIGKTMEEK